MISIVVAAYNRANLLPRALDSLRDQTLTDWEAVIVDDGSTDETPVVLGRYAARDPRFRHLRQANAGLSAARNAGIAVARGELVTFLDSDDEYHPDHLALRERYMRDHPGVDLIHGGLVIVGGRDTVPDLHDPTRQIPIAECFVGGTFFMRAEVARRLGGFRLPDYGNDYDFVQRAQPLFAIETVDFPTYIYHRDSPDSMCDAADRRAV